LTAKLSSSNSHSGDKRALLVWGEGGGGQGMGDGGYNESIETDRQRGKDRH